jgi:hypothetical protein
MRRWICRAMAVPVLGVTGAVLGLVGGPAAGAAASPQAARFASEATAYQNRVIEGALSRLPDGTRISASEARWPDGITVEAPDSPEQNGLGTCTYTYANDFCGFTGSGYTGTLVAFPFQEGYDIWYEWGASVNTGMHSWYNNTPFRVWREQFQNSGNEMCIDPYPYGNYTDSDYSGVNVNDYWVLVTDNVNNC